jgi:hypothetical protein
MVSAPPVLGLQTQATLGLAAAVETQSAVVSELR